MSWSSWICHTIDLNSSKWPYHLHCYPFKKWGANNFVISKSTKFSQDKRFWSLASQIIFPLSSGSCKKTIRLRFLQQNTFLSIPIINWRIKPTLYASVNYLSQIKTFSFVLIFKMRLQLTNQNSSIFYGNVGSPSGVGDFSRISIQHCVREGYIGAPPFFGMVVLLWEIPSLIFPLV